jgi:hypothetical protein
MESETSLMKEYLSALRKDVEIIKEILLVRTNGISLEEEIVSWENASEEDLFNFEKSL